MTSLATRMAKIKIWSTFNFYDERERGEYSLICMKTVQWWEAEWIKRKNVYTMCSTPGSTGSISNAKTASWQRSTMQCCAEKRCNSPLSSLLLWRIARHVFHPNFIAPLHSVTLAPNRHNNALVYIPSLPLPNRWLSLAYRPWCTQLQQQESNQPAMFMKRNEHGNADNYRLGGAPTFISFPLTAKE